MVFGMDGVVHAAPTVLAVGTELSGPSLAPFSAGTWYDVQVRYGIVDASTISLSYSIDGNFLGSFEYPSIAGERALSYLSLVSGAGSAWFDNVSITTIPEPSSFLLMCIGAAWLLLSRRCRS